ncbi:MAG: hypothetical protein HZC28_19710 [Spirochaetes bacterium]|nr:hypothetical protein [Spirochaetota bacterium]
MKRFMFPVSAALALMLTLVPAAHPYAYNPWTTMSGAKNAVINPFVYTTSLNPFGMSIDVLGWYGFTPNFDIAVNAATLSFSSSGFSYGGSWVMPRYDFGNNNIAALQLKMTPSGSLMLYDVVPQYQFFWENDVLATELNAYVDVSFVYANTSFSSSVGTKAGLYAAPVFKLFKSLYLFCEIDPAYTFGIASAFDLAIVPGITILLNEGKHQICVGVPLGNVLHVAGGSTTVSVTPGIAVWYWTAIETGKK